MSEKTEITFMQTRLIRLASEEWHLSVEQIIYLFKEADVFGYISTFEFKLSENLETHIFENADVDWLHCIAAHRKKKMFIEVEREMAKYDIIAGKIADDATNATLTAYLAGAFGTAGDKVADDFCIRQLLPNKLKDQYCFKTEAAIECLKFVKGEKIWLK